MDVKKIQKELDDKYYSQLSAYNQLTESLAKEKEQFIRDNPTFPNPELLFLNVVAPPKRLIFNEIK